MMCLVLSVMAFAQTGVDFQHLTFDEALAKAKAEKKLVFVDCYTTWCGPCKMMTTKIFPMKEAGEFFNPRFVCVKFDMEQGEGKELENKLGVRAYPSFFIIILFFARFFMDHEEDLNTFKTLAKSVILLAIPLFLIYEQPDMKNTLMLLAVFCILIYIAGLSYKIIGGMFLIIIPLAIIFVSIVVQPDQKLIKDYQRKRIMAFLYPENEEYSDDIEQQNNSKTAIASGELIGKKLSGDKEVASVNDGNFVSENQTDFIFAVAGEEYGFMGCCSIVILLLAISVECIRMSLRAKDLSGKIICCGMASIISLQSFLNICVATGIAPNTGTPLPFVSYGLTSLISLYIGMGMVLNVGLQSSAYNKEIRRKAIDQKEDYL